MLGPRLEGELYISVFQYLKAKINMLSAISEEQRSLGLYKLYHQSHILLKIIAKFTTDVSAHSHGSTHRNRNNQE